MGCEVGGEPAPEVSWVTPARGEVRANLSLLELSQVTRADAGQQLHAMSDVCSLVPAQVSTPAMRTMAQVSRLKHPSCWRFSVSNTLPLFVPVK